MQLKGRRVDAWGNVIFTDQGLFELLYRGESLSDLLTEPTEGVKNFNRLCRERDHADTSLRFYEEPTTPIEEWDAERQQQWFVPDKWKDIDVLDWLLMKCHTEEQVTRVLEEWELFKERGMEPVLRFLIYLIDHLKENKILWGVGRGSSVSSYCLYLIGVHRVDSLKYNLDVREFLK